MTRSAPGTAPLRLTVGLCDHDRTRALLDGRVRARGLDLEVLTLPIEELIRRMLRDRDLDAAEMSLSAAVAVADRDPSRFVPLPVFPSRMFRHSALFVRADSAIADPRELRGRTVGTPLYARLTAGVWLRGILEDDYGLAPEALSWVVQEPLPVGGEDGLLVEPGGDLSIRSAGWGTPLEELLLRGEIDALLTARLPAAARDGAVRPLLADPRAVEADYFRRTGIFPMMHCVVVAGDRYRANPWVGRSLFEAFVEAKRVTERDLADIDVSRYSLAWWHDALAAERAVLGPDPWRYGVPGNEAAIERFLGYCHRQGISRRLLSPADLFPPELVALAQEDAAQAPP